MIAKNRVYLDTSAYLALLLGEEQSEEVYVKIKDKVLCSSTLLLIETERNLIHLVRNKQISEESFHIAYEKAIADKEYFTWRCHTPSATGLPVILDFNISAGV